MRLVTCRLPGVQENGADTGVELLLALLDSTPVVDGEQRDTLDTRDWGMEAAAVEVLRDVRTRLQSVVRGRSPAAVLAAPLDGVRQVPDVDDDGLAWRLVVEPAREPAVRAVLAWFALERELPGRLRACANPACTLFLLDRSRAGTGRWCSMATCGNRAKARRHHERHRHSANL